MLIEQIYYLRFRFTILDIQLGDPLPMNRKDLLDLQLNTWYVHGSTLFKRMSER
jgi:hypothetical protein